MTDFSKDPVVNAIHQGIKQGVRVTLDNKCYGSTVILILAGIDAMAFLEMSSQQEDVTRKDFIHWANRYIQFDGKDQLTGEDLYGARCAMIHNYGVRSKLSREGKCRMVGYKDGGKPIVYNPSITKELVMVSIPALAEAFFTGVDQFLIKLFANPEKAKVAEGRLQSLVQCLPIRIDSK
jgi:hypothetical protein